MYAADSATGVKPDFSIQIPVADSKGGQRTVVIDFLKKATPANEWFMEVRSDPPGDVSTADGKISSGTVTFDEQRQTDDGDAAADCSHLGDYASGIAAQTLDLDMTALTQFSSGSTVNSVQPNGTVVRVAGRGEHRRGGFVTAVYANGTTRRMAQIAIATFPNGDGLKSVKGNAYQASIEFRRLHLEGGGHGRRGQAVAVEPRSLDGGSVHRIHGTDHHSARLFGVLKDHHDRRSDA